MSATRVGVLDWGIGGVDALARLRAARPDLDLVYHSDAGTTPYGRCSREALARRVADVADGLGVELVVVACNAASTVLDAVRTPAVGVIEPGLRAALSTPYLGFGVIGGERTITSGVWEAPLRAAGRRVVARVAQPLSAHVEAGRTSGSEVEADLDVILAPLRGQEAAILACTHYPALRGPIAARLPGTALLDPVDALVEEVLGRLGPSTGREGTLRVLTTGDPDAMRTSARAAFGVELGRIELLRP